MGGHRIPVLDAQMNAEDHRYRVKVTSPRITSTIPMNPNCSLMRSRFFQGVPQRVL